MGNQRNYSRGCKTCVQRKVKCDGEHPTCRRCKKAGFGCEGFNEAVFVDAREQVMKRFAIKSKKRSDRGTSVASTNIVSSRQIGSPMRNHTTAMMSMADCNRDPLMVYPAQIRVCSLPSRDELYVSYIVGNLFKGPSASMYCDVLPYKTSNRLPRQLLMSQCLLALATVFYGIQNHESRTLRDGMCLYSRALNVINDMIEKDNTSVTTEIIVSVVAMSICESIMPMRNFSWMIHILGLERLFALRGPSMVGGNNGLDDTLLETCRPVMILAAFFTQRPSLMSHPKWKMTSQAYHPETMPVVYQTSNAVSDMSFLMGVLAELPSLYIECDKLVQLARKQPSHPSTLHISTLWTRVRQLHGELQVWKQKWNNTNENKFSETLPITTLDLPEYLMDWTTVFTFETVDVAITFAMYHSVTILLLSIPTSLLQAGLPPAPPPPPTKTESTSSDPDFDFDLSNESQLPPVADFKTSIHSICRSIEYHFHSLPPAQAPADYYLFFPVHVARRASLQLGCASEFAWLSGAYERLRARYSMGVWASMDFGDRFSGLGEGLFG